jgi:hypothetical protein
MSLQASISSSKRGVSRLGLFERRSRLSLKRKRRIGPSPITWLDPSLADQALITGFTDEFSFN